MAGARRRRPGRLLLLPFLRDHVEGPGVGEQLVELVAAEQDDLLVDRVVAQPRVGPRRRLAVELELRPGVGGGRVGPGAGIAALGLDVAAAEEDELLVVPVVAHRTPQQDAAQLLLRIGLRRQVGPLALDRVVAERGMRDGG